MMMSPETFISTLENSSYEEMISERDELIESIKWFEKTYAEKEGNLGPQLYPSQESVYQMNLEYLSRLCILIEEKFQKDFLKREEEDEEED